MEWTADGRSQDLRTRGEGTESRVRELPHLAAGRQAIPAQEAPWFRNSTTTSFWWRGVLLARDFRPNAPDKRRRFLRVEEGTYEKASLQVPSPL